MKTVLIAGTVALAVAAAPAFAQTSAPNQDHTFVMKAAQGGMAEVQLGQMAAERASSQQVKDFAQRMVTDHSKANDELKTIAQKENITLSSGLDAKDQALHDRLMKLSGEAFDRAYMRAMLRDHRMDIKEFRHESQMGRDPDVKAFASAALPTLEEHLKMAEQTDKAVVGTSGTTTKKHARKHSASTTSTDNPK